MIKFINTVKAKIRINCIEVATGGDVCKSVGGGYC